MILHGDPQLVHATGAKNVHRPPDDPRVDAFHALLAAIDAGRAKEGVEATRRLRALGLRVVILPPRGPGAGR